MSQQLYILALALGISGLIAYKTIQWVLYEEIGPGSAALFLSFALLVFLGINNYDFGKRLTPRRERSPGIEEKLDRINAEIQKQVETTRLLAESVGKVSEKTNLLATEADKNSRGALEKVKASQAASEEAISVTAWAAWEILIEEYMEIESYLKRWEEKNGLRRGRDTARSMAELARNLERFDTALPEPIKTLYFERHRKHEILKRIKETSESTASRHAGAVFDLPAPPRLPATVTVSKEPESRNPVR